MHQYHSALERIYEGIVMLVIGWWRSIHRDVEAEDLGVEGRRTLNIRDGQSEVVNGTHGKVRHGSLLRRCDARRYSAIAPRERPVRTCRSGAPSHVDGPSFGGVVRCGDTGASRVGRTVPDGAVAVA